MLLTTLTILLALAAAIPLKPSNTLTAASILKISPSTRSCDNPPAAGECRTATQATPYIALSFTNFGITAFAEQAALVALMLYESGSFKYSVESLPWCSWSGDTEYAEPGV